MINNVKSSQNSFSLRFFFFEGIVNPKKLEIKVVEMLGLFLVGCFVITIIPKLFSSF
jgi:hypothetical protein